MPRPLTPPAGACTVEGPRHRILLTAAATALLVRACGPAILGAVLGIVEAHRAEGARKSRHRVQRDVLTVLKGESGAVLAAATDLADAA